MERWAIEVYPSLGWITEPIQESTWALRVPESLPVLGARGVKPRRSCSGGAVLGADTKALQGS